MSTGIVIFNARILTLAPRAGESDLPRRGARACDLGVLDPGYIEVDGDGTIVRLGTGLGESPAAAGRTRIDGKGRVVLPAWVDCHTHACFAGDRAREWQMKQVGASYLEILAAGGGIMSTVRAVRAASSEALLELLLGRLRVMHQLGAGTVEVKTGYGLDTPTELRMLQVISAAGQAQGLGTPRAPVEVHPTFLGAHALDPSQSDGVTRMIEETLPAVAAAYPGICCDAFCETGAWSLADCLRYFSAAKRLGLPIRVHADQFNSLGMVSEAISLGARTVDHLEATTDADLAQLARSTSIGVALPCTPFALGTPSMRAREFLDQGGALAIASNFNPGSAPSPSLSFSIYLATRFMRLSLEEAITAATWNAACALSASDHCGCLAPKRRAQLQMLAARDELSLLASFADAGPDLVLGLGGAIGVDTNACRSVNLALGMTLAD
ncbi:MAG: imidazolonepropionase [Phycisphaerales bacterium]|nr:imidazolonepropionase [Phycisphaerales bacterium]